MSLSRLGKEMSLGKFATERCVFTYGYARVALFWRPAAAQFNIVVPILAQQVTV